MIYIRTMIQKIKLVVYFFVLFYGCSSQYPDDVELVLNKSGENKEQLIKAIEHFKELGDEKKIEATYYLIAGMNNKYSYTGETYNALREKILAPKLELDSLSLLPKFTYQKIRNIQKRKAGRVARELMKQNEADFGRVEDCKIISSDYIINNVEQAFEAWSMPWSKKNVNFNQFCEYILPYKIGNEVIIDWRKKVLNDFSWVNNSNMVDLTLKEVCMRLNDSIRYKFRQDTSLDYPIQFDYDTMKFFMRGSCEHTTNFAIFVMRGLGIPVSKEISAFLNETSHKWAALHISSDSIVPFEAATNKHGFDLIYEGAAKTKYNIKSYESAPYRKIVKVERIVYNVESIKNGNNINLSKDKYDVTSEYVPVSDVQLDVKHPYFKKKTYALSSFNRQLWKPTFFSDSRTNNVKFENLAQGVIYLPQIITETGILPNGKPFFIDNVGGVNTIELDRKNKQSVRLTRKYPLHKRVQHWSNGLIGSRFQVANSLDFNDAITVGVIKEAPSGYFTEIDVKLDSQYRYFRLLFPKTQQKVSIAEVQVYDDKNEMFNGTKKPRYRKLIGKNMSSGQIRRALDNDLLSYAEASTDTTAWMGMDLTGPRSYSKIRYLQRTDLNMIVPGNKYELVYWDDRWVSLGVKVAKEEQLVFENAPKNALFLLHNLTEGKEERIFIHEDGKQVFY